MKNISLWGLSMLLFAGTASAASIEERGSQLDAQLNGKHGYHAELARELAGIADEEKSQHDTGVAKAFMTFAEEEAQKAGQ